MERDGRTNDWHTAVMLHGIDVLPRLRRLDYETRKQILHEASQHNLENPLWLDGGQKKYVVSTWGPEKLTGGGVTALMVFGLWVQVGEHEGMAAMLLKDWPEILTVVQTVAVQERQEQGESKRDDPTTKEQKAETGRSARPSRTRPQQSRSRQKRHGGG